MKEESAIQWDSMGSDSIDNLPLTEYAAILQVAFQEEFHAQPMHVLNDRITA